MGDVDKQTDDLIAAWSVASERLGFRIVAPFDFNRDGASYKCVAYLPDFGGPTGMVLQAIFPPHFTVDKNLARDVKKAGYYMSFINADCYSKFDPHQFEDALNDWGFYGPAALCPNWLETARNTNEPRKHPQPLTGDSTYVQ
jgi:hypothetical protein